MMFDANDLIPVLPEILVAVGAMALLMLGVFMKDASSERLSLPALLLLVAAAATLHGVFDGPAAAFNGAMVLDGYVLFMKTLVILGGGLAILMSNQFLKTTGINRFEFPVLVVLATLGMMVMVSANDLLTLYVGLELQSLSLYVLASFARDRNRSTEAGLKYFVLGALSSGMLLYGMSLIYGFSGTLSFDVLADLTADGDYTLGLLVGIVFLASGLAFKISAVPFHMWTPDVYEGAPTPVTAFFAIAPKVAAMALFVRALMIPFADLVDQWQQVIIFLAVLSMLLGAFLALVQTNLKRLMAYSSIANVGYALVALSAGTAEGVQGVVIFMALYLLMTAGTFGVILSLRRKDGLGETINDLSGLARTNPGMALAMAIMMFSLAGIPGLAGFFGKFYAFLPAIEAGLVWLAVVGMISSVVAAFYYLRIVKVMYFDEPLAALEPQTDRGIGGVILITAVLNSPVHLLLIGFLVTAAGVAARALVV